jgi:hypothetical protein
MNGLSPSKTAPPRDHCVITGLVAARATDDVPTRLVAAMAMLSPHTKSGRSKAFISSYLRRENPPQRDER